MIKKILILAIVSLFSTNAVFAFRGSDDVITINGQKLQVQTPTASISINDDGEGAAGTLVGDDLQLSTDVKHGVGVSDGTVTVDNNSCICTTEYEPVCAKKNGKLVTFPNKCNLKCAVKKNKKDKEPEFLYKGECIIKENKKNNSDNLSVGVKVNPPTLIKAPNTNIDLKVIDEDGENSIKLKADNDVKKQNNNNGDKQWGGEYGIFGDKNVKIQSGIKIKKNGAKLVIDGEETGVSLDDVKLSARTATSTKEIVKTDIKKDDDGKVKFFVKTKNTGKLFGLFNIDFEAVVKVDSKTGDVLDVDEPWYSFLIF